MDKNAISIVIRACNVIVSLLLPITAVVFIGYTLNYCWQMNPLSMAVYTFSIALAVSAFNKNVVYRLVVSAIGLFISFQLTDIWPMLQVLFSIFWATCFAHNLNFLKWGKYFWVIIPHAILRGIIIWTLMPIMPCVTDGDSLDKNIFGLLMFTYTIIFILFSLDFIVYMLARKTFVKYHRF